MLTKLVSGNRFIIYVRQIIMLFTLNYTVMYVNYIAIKLEKISVEQCAMCFKRDYIYLHMHRLFSRRQLENGHGIALGMGNLEPEDRQQDPCTPINFYLHAHTLTDCISSLNKERKKRKGKSWTEEMSSAKATTKKILITSGYSTERSMKGKN